MTSLAVLSGLNAALCLLAAVVSPASGQQNRAAADGRLLVEPAPRLDIAGTAADGQPILGQALDATRLSNGTVVVADRGASQLVFVDSLGQVVRRVGRRGRGPGEFVYLAALRQCRPDSLYAVDPIQSLVAVFDSAGRPIRQFRPTRTIGGFQCARTGTLLLTIPQPVTSLPSEKSPVYGASVLFLDTQGDSVGSIGEVKMGQNRPMATVTQFAVAPDRLYVGTGDSAIVHMFDTAGHHLGTVPAGELGRPTTSMQYEYAIDKIAAKLRAEADRTSVKKFMMGIPMPATLPPYSKLLADPDGLLWVVTSVGGGGVTEVRAVTPSGEAIGGIRFPMDLEIVEIGRDYVLGLYETEAGEQHVAMYRYQRRP